MGGGLSSPPKYGYLQYQITAQENAANYLAVFKSKSLKPDVGIDGQDVSSVFLVCALQARFKVTWYRGTVERNI